METKLNFKSSAINGKNIKIILSLLVVFVGLLAFGILRDSDQLITHKQANSLYSQDKIQKVIVDGEYIRLKTADNSYKIYKDAINKTAFFTKYPVEVTSDSSYIYDILSLLIILGAFGLLYRFIKQSKLQQLRQIRSVNRADNADSSEPVQALSSNVTFADVAGIKDVKEDVVSWLKTINRVDVFYEPDQRPVICRCGANVEVGVFAGQWFLDYLSPGWKEESSRALANMGITPDIFRNLFEATFDWLAQRPCARRRGIGTRLPFDPDWIIESLSDSTIYMAFYTIAHHITNNKLKSKQLTYEFFDYVFLGKGTPVKVSKITEIDAGLLKKMRNEFMYWYPNDQRHTAPSHISNHLSFAIFHHVAIFPEKHWIQLISLSEHMNMEGKKMSKSKGNVIPLVELPKKYGADVFRIYAISAAEPGTLMDWREKDVPSMRNRMRQFIQITTKYAKKAPRAYTKKDNPTMVTRWMLSRVNSLIQDCTDMIDNFRLREYAIHVSSEMIRAINHYLNREGVPKEEREATMAYVCDKWVRLAAPMTPHICEELWSKMGHDDYVSLSAWPKPNKKLIDRNVENAHEVVESTIRDIREIKKLLKGKDAKKVHVYVAPEWMFKAMNSIREANLPTVIGDIMKHLMANEDFRKHGKAVKSIVDRIAKENGLWDHSVKSKEEMAALKDSAEHIGNEFKLEVVIHSSEKPDYDPQNKARFALPGRVSLFLE